MSDQPQQIGKYKILGVLGKGAMGLVYRAEDPLLKRQVAVKVISGEEVNEEMKQRFQHEARAAAGTDHPNIVVVYDLGEHEGQPYIAMELLKGDDLRSLMRRRPNLPLREAIEIIIQVCDGLAYAHERKIVHRDIKPANIHICPDARVKIVDFGVAKMESTGLTKTGMVIGTPDYMSPEQIQGKAVDARSDIFSVGVVFYEMLTRNKPFRAESITSVIYNIVFKQPASFQELKLDVPAEIERIIGKAMAKDLKDRYQAIGEMATDLRRFLGQSTQVLSGVAGPATQASDATTALTSEEVAAATRGAASPAERTVRVAESPTMRDRLAQAEPTVGPTPPAPQKSKLPLLVGGGLAAVILVGVILAVVLGGGEEPAPPPVASDTTPGTGVPASVPVEVLVLPWANIDRLERLDGSKVTVVAVSEPTTPVRLELPPGSYRMKVSNPALSLVDTIEFSVKGPEGERVKHVLADFDAAQALAASLQAGT